MRGSTRCYLHSYPQHVEREGSSAALGNNKSLLVYYFEQDHDVDNSEKVWRGREPMN